MGMQQLELEKVEDSTVELEDSEGGWAALRGKFSTGGRFSYTASDGVFSVFNSSGRCCSKHFFGGGGGGLTQTDAKASITAFTELVYEDGRVVLLICVHHSSGDVLHLCSPTSSLIQRSIKLPRKAVCITAFHTNSNFQTEPIRSFQALAAIGFSPAQVIIVDVLTGDLSTGGRQTTPVQLDMLDLLCNTPPAIRKANSQPAIQLEACCCDGRRFQYMEPDGNVVANYRRTVSVTAIEYFPAWDLLAIGYDIGAFQLWAVSSPELLFSSTPDDNMPPVRFFSLQVPVDDPRNCVYIWVGYTGAAEESTAGEFSDDFATLIMYQMNFENDSDQMALRTCRPWYRQEIVPDLFYEQYSSFSFNRSQILTMSVIHKIGESDSSLMYFSWLYENTTEAPGLFSVQMCIFDLDSWYQAQMPQKIRLLTNQKYCPYVSFYSCGQVLTEEDIPLDLRLEPSAIARFIPFAVPPEDFFSFPSSLSFSASFLTDRQILLCSSAGLQNTVLNALDDLDLNDATEISGVYEVAVSAKIVDGQETSTPLDVKIDRLISLLADNCKVEKLVCIISDMRAVEANAEDPLISSEAIIQQLWRIFSELKQKFDSFCLPLFSDQLPTIDDNFRKQFDIYHAQIDCLASVLTSTRELESGVNETQLAAIECVGQYYEAVGWLLRSGFLPESADGEGGDCFRLPVCELEQLWRECVGRSPVEGPLLLVLLLEEHGAALQYPPTSLYTFLSSLYMNQLPVAVKAAIVQYLFLDIRQCQSEPGALSSSGVFLPQQQSPVWLKLITAIWNVDKCRIDNARELLFSCQSKLISKSLQYGMILRFFVMGDFTGASSLINKWKFTPSRETERKLCLSVEISCQNWEKCLLLVRGGCEETIEHLLTELIKLELLCEFLLIDWGRSEDCIVRVMSSSEKNVVRQALIFYLIIHCRNSEAYGLWHKWEGEDVDGNTMRSDFAFFLKTVVPPMALRAASFGAPRDEVRLTQATMKPVSSVARFKSATTGTCSVEKLLEKCVARAPTAKNSFLMQPLRKQLTETAPVPSPSVTLAHPRRTSLLTSVSSEDSVKELLSTPEIKRTNKARLSQIHSGTSILKDTDDVATCSSTLFGGLGLKPHFTGVDSPGNTPNKPKFEKTPMPRGRISKLSQNEKTTSGALDQAFVNAADEVSPKVLSDNEITFRTTDQSTSSTETANSTLPIDNNDIEEQPGGAVPANTGRVLFPEVDDDVQFPNASPVNEPMEQSSGEAGEHEKQTLPTAGLSDDVSFTYSPPVIRVSSATRKGESGLKQDLDFKFSQPTSLTPEKPTRYSEPAKPKYWEFKPPPARHTSSPLVPSPLTTNSKAESDTLSKLSPRALSIATPSPRRSSRVQKRSSGSMRK